MKYGKITKIEAGSLAEEIGLVVGDKLLKINDTEPRDIIDVSFLMADEEIELLIEHEGGEQEVIAFEKDLDEQLGVEYDAALFDGIRNCANKCYFCFVDQVAPNMRQALSIKDDDYRLSFLYGNFVTMTNMGERDYKRIAQYHLSPLYISVQCTNPELRCKLIGSKRAGEILDNLARLEEADIDYHTQVVCCPDLNDGEELERTIRDITARTPHAQSLAIVPVGLTKFRNNLHPLRAFTKDEARKVIEMVEPWQEKMRQKVGRTFIYLADEFYFIAGVPVPPTSYYDGFPQLDNGIGLTRNFIEEFKEAKAKADIVDKKKLLVLSGEAVAPMFSNLATDIGLADYIKVVPVPNEHFGRSVNVTGLLTAKDMLATISKEEADGILIPGVALRKGDNIFLDDMRLDDFLAKLPAEGKLVSNGYDYWEAITNWSEYQGTDMEKAKYTWQSNAAYTK